MKNKVLLYLLIALPAILLQSCLKDQEDLFDEASSLRLQKTLEVAHDALVNNQTYWVLDFYPEEEQSYGGTPMVFHFDKGRAKAWRLMESDEKGSGEEIIITDESDYKMTNDFGPVLSFDTYNDVVHYYSTPRGTSAWYEAMHGDFEFVVDSIGKEVIKIHGKKSQNTMYLRALKSEPEEYLKAVDAIFEKFTYKDAKAQHENAETAIGFDLDYRQLIFRPGTLDKEYHAFCFTDKGIRMYAPVEINGHMVDDFTLDDGSNRLVATQASSTIDLILPVGYKKYNEWEGNYEFVFQTVVSGEYVTQHMPVTLVPAGDNVTYLMKGLNPNYDLVLNYSRSEGGLELLTQRVGTLANNNFVLLTSWDTNTGTVNYTTTYGMRTQWDEAKQTYKWVDTGRWSQHEVTSFILYEMSAATTRVGQCTDASFQIAGSYRLYNVSSLDKVD